MLNLKKTALAVLALSSSGVLFAGTMGPVCTPTNVTIPCESPAWDVGGQALFLKPSYSGIGAYGVETSASDPTSFADADPKWTWGFQIEGSYHFDTGNDVNVNWWHLGRKTTTVNIPYTVDVGPDATVADSAGPSLMRVRPQWDAVNFEMGQHVDFGEYKVIRFHAGAQYGRIETGTSLSGSVDTAGLAFDTANYGLSSKSKYNGFGPRIGSDLSYGIGNGLAIFGNGAATLLAGTSKISQNLTFVGNGIAQRTVTRSGSRTAIVPELEGKLGLLYDYAMPQGDITLDVGYMWINYFNAQQFAGPEGIRLDDNFGIQGLYFGGKWVGTVI